MEKNSGQIENKAPDITGLMITAILNTKIDEVEKKLPGTSALAFAAVLNRRIYEVENKIPDVSKSVKTHRGTIFYFCWLY